MTNKEYGYYNNNRYRALETLYLSTKDEKYLSEMYEFLLHYYSFKLKKYASLHNHHFTEEDADDLIHRMASRSVCHYLYHPKTKGDFKMGNLSAYASFDFIKILFDEKNRAYESNETSLDEIIESYDNNQPDFNIITVSETDKVDFLFDAERALSPLDYRIVKAIVECPGMSIDDLSNEFELPKKSLSSSIDKIQTWYKEWNEEE